ncbi:talin rod domain-containing protein 1-like [Anabrus simplex]|uniref:talin rod domain-containing protein 1-like n=1 Tax=Anabrus simplex TaxID=316456 RepID=UPI0035A370D7
MVEKVEAAFRTLKESQCKAQIPNPVDTDASDVEIGGVLSEVQDGQYKVIAYFRKRSVCTVKEMAPEKGRQDSNSTDSSKSGALEREDVSYNFTERTLEARALALTCDLCQHRMQTVADLLLLTSDTRPVRTASLSVFGESVGRCRETVASRTRGLTVLLRDLAALVGEDNTGIRELRACIEEICDLVVSLIECCAHAGYLLAVLQDGSSPEVPGPVDRYQLCRAAAEIEHKTGLLRTYGLHTVTALQLTDICINVTESANILTDGCLKAADEAHDDNIREQFRLCLKSIAAAVNTFCGSVKFLKDRPTELNYRACQVFGESLTTTCNALAVFATQDSQLTGSGAALSQAGRETLHGVLSGCMGVASPCVLVCSAIHDLAMWGTLGRHDTNDKVATKVQQCHAAILRSAARLAQALGSSEH